VTRVLVTGAGGAAGVSVIRALLASGVDPVAGDPDPLAAGCHLVDDRIALPYAADIGFGRALVAAATAAGVDAVICTVAEEMPALAAVTNDLEAAGIAIWLPPVAAVHTCIDKARFAAVVAGAGLPTPATRAGAADGVPGPWVVKPRYGRGSRSVWSVDDAADLPAAIRRTPEPLVQTRCPGREFTVDALTDRDGSVVGLVPRWRLETKAGISTKGTTFSDDRVARLVRDVVAVLGLEGACNVQGFVDRARDEVWLLEVNPRFSGGLPLSLAAGADLVGEFLRGTLGQPLRPERLAHRDGVTMTRHLTEVIVEPSRAATPVETAAPRR
jgi:carbamoyl-phosphate synthase large subunit